MAMLQKSDHAICGMRACGQLWFGVPRVRLHPVEYLGKVGGADIFPYLGRQPQAPSELHGAHPPQRLLEAPLIVVPQVGGEHPYEGADGNPRRISTDVISEVNLITQGACQRKAEGKNYAGALLANGLMPETSVKPTPSSFVDNNALALNVTTFEWSKVKGSE